jgi:hypothetical protein
VAQQQQQLVKTGVKLAGALLSWLTCMPTYGSKGLDYGLKTFDLGSYKNE